MLQNVQTYLHREITRDYTISRRLTRETDGIKKGWGGDNKTKSRSKFRPCFSNSYRFNISLPGVSDF